jgi:hypothetical protein
MLQVVGFGVASMVAGAVVKNVAVLEGAVVTAVVVWSCSAAAAGEVLCSWH